MKLLSYFAIAFAVICIACGVAEDMQGAVDDSYLFGKWNIIENTKEFESALYFYEDGFELTEERKYYPRYFREEQNQYFTDTSYRGEWYIDKEKRLVFLQKYINTSDSTFFELEKISDDKIRIKQTIGEYTIFIAKKE